MENDKRYGWIPVNPTDETLKQRYGQHAVITRVGQINIIHLDRPDKETIKKRVEEVLREEIRGEVFEEDCPLCRQLKDHPYDVVYDEEK